MKIYQSAAAIALFLVAQSISAQCFHNGTAYNTGDIIGEYVCAANGTWVKR